MVDPSKKFGLHIWDPSSGCKFFVVILPIKALHTHFKGPPLQAVNGSSIHTFGTCIMSIVIGDRHFSWEFVIADVSQPLLGADFFMHQWADS